MCRLIPAWAGKTPGASVCPGSDRAHPRVGGENSPPSSPSLCAAGSSPRGRGKLSYSPRCSQTHRLIPAWAGKTTHDADYRRNKPAHPRVGGENSRAAAMSSFAAGSSPRGRGKHLCMLSAPLRGRLIPAWAGKTHTAFPTTHPSSAHPRVGGENTSCVAVAIFAAGSSPRGRGKPETPESWATSSVAHPRVGGENYVNSADIAQMPGSSPRGRGKPQTASYTPSRPRLIPAWAGKTKTLPAHHVSSEAHPRVGGENRAEIAALQTRAGSSPRGRGKHAHLRPGLEVPGLIPAWAGKTAHAWMGPRPAAAHPRVGGENNGADFDSTYAEGSSPRGRGKRHPQIRLGLPTGLIPAWAGKTDVGMGVGVGPWAHPRVGGENGRWAYRRCASSRLIPAWAGKTSNSLLHPFLPPAHPRVGGENKGTYPVLTARRGSPPRGRGKPTPPHNLGKGNRLIPAWAGKTTTARQLAKRAGAHPRVGGENRQALARLDAAGGSSPRGRGKHK